MIDLHIAEIFLGCNGDCLFKRMTIPPICQKTGIGQLRKLELFSWHNCCCISNESYVDTCCRQNFRLAQTHRSFSSCSPPNHDFVCLVRITFRRTAIIYFSVSMNLWINHTNVLRYSVHPWVLLSSFVSCYVVVD